MDLDRFAVPNHFKYFDRVIWRTLGQRCRSLAQKPFFVSVSELVMSRSATWIEVAIFVRQPVWELLVPSVRTRTALCAIAR